MIIHITGFFSACLAVKFLHVQCMSCKSTEKSVAEAEEYLVSSSSFMQSPTTCIAHMFSSISTINHKLKII